MCRIYTPVTTKKIFRKGFNFFIFVINNQEPETVEEQSPQEQEQPESQEEELQEQPQVESPEEQIEEPEPQEQQVIERVE